MADQINREKIDYLVCGKCGVVFADRDDPECCPICGSDPENFIKYDDYLKSRATSSEN